ncbi:hypothetical protein LMG28727_02064 [Paraburkholderia kirstenboschensis]|uniref:hypothetical protein n=1 Tax=Paraburkholderia kirstenboschensis TaxID=1245436 RepID=UPI000AEA8D66|nr:hypothetical protein [Paraburkholderia kirstenboschensis]CAD6525639.1 hypothetical protein LMG28727_02064 [Paraburkholderia kirstenboschensis]
MNTTKLAIVALAAAFSHGALADTTPKYGVTREPGKVSVTGTVKTKSTIVGIEPDTRTVWLKDSKGKIVQVTVGEEARNFSQLKLGDTVAAEYTQALTLSLKKTTGPATVSESQTLNRAPEGAKPGGTAARAITVMANVVALNPQTNVVTLKGPQGNSVDIVVEDPEQFKRIKKGDQVEVVYNEAVAISVEPQEISK